MPLIDFIRPMEGSQDEFDVELEEFDADSEQGTIGDDTLNGCSRGRLLLVTLLLVGVAYAVSWPRSSSGDPFTDIAFADDPAEGDSVADEKTGTGDDATDDEDATVTVEHDPEAETDDAVADDETAKADEMDDANGEEADTDDDGAVEVEIESPGDDKE